MKKLLIATLVTLPLAFAANAEMKDCSTKAAKTTSKAELEKTAKIKPEDAQQIAMKGMKGASIVKGGIETEDGCLVYSYHVKQAGSKGQTEVLVDAGTGVVLKREEESAVRAAAEKPVDKTKELAGKAKEKVAGTPSTNHSMPSK